MILPPWLLTIVARYGVYIALALLALVGYAWFTASQREVGRRGEQERVTREQAEARRQGDKAVRDAERLGAGELLDRGRY